MKQGGLNQDKVFTNTILLSVAILFAVAGWFTTDFTSEIFYITAIAFFFIFLLTKFQSSQAQSKDIAVVKLVKLTLLLIGIIFVSAVVYLAVVIK